MRAARRRWRGGFRPGSARTRRQWLQWRAGPDRMRLEGRCGIENPREKAPTGRVRSTKISAAWSASKVLGEDAVPRADHAAEIPLRSAKEVAMSKNGESYEQVAA